MLGVLIWVSLRRCELHHGLLLVYCYGSVGLHHQGLDNADLRSLLGNNHGSGVYHLFVGDFMDIRLTFCTPRKSA